MRNQIRDSIRKKKMLCIKRKRLCMMSLFPRSHRRNVSSNSGKKYIRALRNISAIWNSWDGILIWMAIIWRSVRPCSSFLTQQRNTVPNFYTLRTSWTGRTYFSCRNSIPCNGWKATRCIMKKIHPCRSFWWHRTVIRSRHAWKERVFLPNGRMLRRITVPFWINWMRNRQKRNVSPLSMWQELQFWQWWQRQASRRWAIIRIWRLCNRRYRLFREMCRESRTQRKLRLRTQKK